MRRQGRLKNLGQMQQMTSGVSNWRTARAHHQSSATIVRGPWKLELFGPIGSTCTVLTSNRRLNLGDLYVRMLGDFLSMLHTEQWS